MGQAMQIGQHDRLSAWRVEAFQAAPQGVAFGEAGHDVFRVLFGALQGHGLEIVDEVGAGLAAQDVEGPVAQDA